MDKMPFLFTFFKSPWWNFAYESRYYVSMCVTFTWASHFPYGALSFGGGKKEHWFGLSSNTDLHRQAGATPRWRGDIQPLSTARLSDVSISVFAYPHFSLWECEKFRLSVSSSSVCIPLLYLGFYHTLLSLFSSACYLITCASVFAAGLSLHLQGYDKQHDTFIDSINPVVVITLSDPPYWWDMVTTFQASFLCFLYVFHQRENESCQTRNLQQLTKWFSPDRYENLPPKHNFIL